MGTAMPYLAVLGTQATITEEEAGLTPMALVPLCCSCSRCEHQTPAQGVCNSLSPVLTRQLALDDARLEVLLKFFTPSILRIFLKKYGTLDYFLNSINLTLNSIGIGVGVGV